MSRRILHFTASWCGPCRRVAPLIASLREAHPDICVETVDVDEDTGGQQATHAVTCMPTLVALLGDQEQARVEGVDEVQIRELFVRLAGHAALPYAEEARVRL